MNYDDLINTLTEIIRNDKVYKTGLTLLYELESKNHEKMDEHLFYKSNPPDAIFKHKDVFEVEISNIKVKFIKKNLDN